MCMRYTLALLNSVMLSVVSVASQQASLASSFQMLCSFSLLLCLLLNIYHVAV